MAAGRCEDAKLLGNGLCCCLVVTRDHDHANTCDSAVLNRRLTLRPWRIQNADHAHEGQARLDLRKIARLCEQLVACVTSGAIISLKLPQVLGFNGHAHSSQGGFGHCLQLAFDRASPLVRQGLNLPVRKHDLRASLDEHFGCALGKKDVASSRSVVPQDAHGFSVSAELEHSLLLHACLPILGESHGILLRPLFFLKASLVESLVRTPQLLHQDSNCCLCWLTVADELVLVIHQQSRLVAHATNLC
mmetsp:Transcript_54036/g.126189  ORF Transcript_54036/g.126189 Transcript_54036/m.126189 type:complete len:247 (-) Transcript_54036:1340-2080(-)